LNGSKTNDVYLCLEVVQGHVNHVDSLVTFTFSIKVTDSPFYPCNAMLAWVFATATYPSVRLSVHHAPVLCQNV